MFLVDGKMSWVRPLGDGRHLYWRRLDPPAILTQSELAEVQRLNGVALLVPLAWTFPTLVLFALWREGTMPLVVLLIVAVMGLLFSVVAASRANRRRENILDAAPPAPAEPLMPLSTRLFAAWKPLLGSRPLIVLSATTFFLASASTLGRLAGVTEFDGPDAPSLARMLPLAMVSGILLYVSVSERRRRRGR